MITIIIVFCFTFTSLPFRISLENDRNIAITAMTIVRLESKNMMMMVVVVVIQW